MLLLACCHNKPKLLGSTGFFEHLNDKLNNTNNKVNVLGIPVSKFGVGNVATLFSQKEPGKHIILTFVNPGACDLANKHAGYTQLLELSR